MSKEDFEKELIALAAPHQAAGAEALGKLCATVGVVQVPDIPAEKRAELLALLPSLLPQPATA
jgi:hypothetical protein